MVESPKEPPNVEFGVAFPQTAVVQKKTESTQEIEQTDGENLPTSVILIADIQEPIDVNIPVDTTNIFYAYEEKEVDNSFQPQQSQQPLDSFSASTSVNQETIDTFLNQPVNIENDDTVAPAETIESENQSTNSSESSKSCS